MYIPNIVDYMRYFFSISGFYFGFVADMWLYFIICYFIAIVLDAFDGKIARYFN